MVLPLLRDLVEAGVWDCCSGGGSGTVRSRGDRACDGGGEALEEEEEEEEAAGKAGEREIPGRPGGQEAA